MEVLGKYLQENAGYVEELDDSLYHMDQQSKKLAHSLLRFSDAVEDVTKNYKKWNKALASGNMEEMAEAAAEMTDAYGDMLDMDGSTLSADFLESAENLELMQQAANGSAEAYEQLRQNALEDIVTHVFVDDTEAQQKAFSLADELQSQLKDLEVGATIDDANIYQQLNQLINSTEMTRDQVEDLLTGMGVDADIEKVEVPETQRQATIDAVPHVGYEDVKVPSVVQDDEGGTVNEKTVQVPTISYDAVPDVDESEGEKTVSV